jgi:hypothetical protein
VYCLQGLCCFCNNIPYALPTEYCYITFKKILAQDTLLIYCSQYTVPVHATYRVTWAGHRRQERQDGSRNRADNHTINHTQQSVISPTSIPARISASCGTWATSGCKWYGSASHAGPPLRLRPRFGNCPSSVTLEPVASPTSSSIGLHHVSACRCILRRYHGRCNRTPLDVMDLDAQYKPYSQYKPPLLCFMVLGPRYEITTGIILLLATARYLYRYSTSNSSNFQRSWLEHFQFLYVLSNLLVFSNVVEFQDDDVR